MLGGLIDLLIVLVLIVAFCAILLWAVNYFFPEIGKPARYVVGAIAVILILLAIRQIVTGGGLPVLGL